MFRNWCLCTCWAVLSLQSLDIWVSVVDGGQAFEYIYSLFNRHENSSRSPPQRSSTSSPPLIMSLELGWCVAVNRDTVVPLKYSKEDVRDPEGLLPPSEYENLEDVELARVALTGGTDNYLWLEHATRCQRAKRLVGRLAVAIEIKEALRSYRSSRGRSSRAPRGKEDVVALKIRGHVALFQNTPSSLVLYMRKGHEVEELHWILGELQESLARVAEEATLGKRTSLESFDAPTESAGSAAGASEITDDLESPSGSAPRPPPETLVTDEDKLRDEVLEKVTDHSRCKRVWFAKSRNEFQVQVTRSSRAGPRRFVVPHLNKKRRVASSSGALQDLRDTYRNVMVDILQALDNLGDEDEDLGDHDEEVQPAEEE